MNRGRSTLGTIATAFVLAWLGYGLLKFGPVYYREWRFELAMDKAFRNYGATGEDFMIDSLIRKADALGLPPLTAENFDCDCKPGTDSVLQCSYTEMVRFPGGSTIALKRQTEVRAPLPREPEPEAAE